MSEDYQNFPAKSGLFGDKKNLEIFWQKINHIFEKFNYLKNVNQ